MATEATPPTLPSDARQATLSTVIAEAISAGLRLETDHQRRDETVDSYR